MLYVSANDIWKGNTSNSTGIVDSLNNMPLPKQVSTAQSIPNDNGGYVPAGNGDLIAKTPSKLLTLIQDEESQPLANTNASPYSVQLSH